MLEDMVNIFMTNDCPWYCASKLDDARVNKMLLESTQMLAIAANAHLKCLYGLSTRNDI